MFTTVKKSKIVSVFGRCLRMLLILGTIFICIEACSKDEEEIKKESPPKENPPGEGNQGGGQDTIVAPADSLEADVVSQYLKLVNATKTPGQPPAGGDGAIWNDVKDTIYLMRGLPVGDRVGFLHDPAINITGFYVYVPGASYYYDVPNVPEEGKDSTDVVYVDAEFPVADFIDYPITFPVYLMPYVDGIPFSTFIEPVKIEDPKDSDEAQIIPDTRDFCKDSVGLTYNLYHRVHNGNHDLTPGGNTVNLQLPPSPEPPVSFLSQNTYELVYTCNTLVLTRGGSEGEEWGFVYRRFFNEEDVVDLFDFHLDWYDNKNNPFLYWLP